MKKYNRIFLILLFLFTIIITVIISNTEEPSIIRMTADGYEPRELIIAQNSAVRFVNEADTARWPASNLHPTHEIYPEFDPQRELAPSEEWTFIFGKPGNWKFHDHIHPHMRGTVTVIKADSVSSEMLGKLNNILQIIKTNLNGFLTSTHIINSQEKAAAQPLNSEEARKLVVAKMTECNQNQGRGKCYKHVADALTKKIPPVEILNIFRESENTPEVFAKCHEVTHYIGRKLFESEKNMPEAYAKCQPSCWGGCYHGVLEQYFNSIGVLSGEISESKVRENIVKICNGEEKKSNTRLYSECLHGIGHAMMFITDGNLTKSLQFCDELQGTGQQESCYGGAFMENSSSSTNIDHPSKFISASDPLYPCNILEYKYLSTCYKYQSSHFALISRHDWAKVVDLCLQTPKEFQNGCFHIMGSNQIGFTQDFDLMINNCKLTKQADHRRSCFDGAASGLGGRYVGDSSYLISFCSKIDPQNKRNCYNTMGDSISSWGVSFEQRKKMCGQIIDDEFLNLCLRVGGKA